MIVDVHAHVFVGRQERARIMGGNAARLYWK